MLLVANVANAKWCKKKWLNPGTWVLIWEYSARAIQWIPTWQCPDVVSSFFCHVEAKSLPAYHTYRVRFQAKTVARAHKVRKIDANSYLSWFVYHSPFIAWLWYVLRLWLTCLHSYHFKIYVNKQFASIKMRWVKMMIIIIIIIKIITITIIILKTIITIIIIIVMIIIIIIIILVIKMCVYIRCVYNSGIHTFSSACFSGSPTALFSWSEQQGRTTPRQRSWAGQGRSRSRRTEGG